MASKVDVTFDEVLISAPKKKVKESIGCGKRF